MGANDAAKLPFAHVQSTRNSCDASRDRRWVGKQPLEFSNEYRGRSIIGQRTEPVGAAPLARAIPGGQGLLERVDNENVALQRRPR